MAKVNRHIRWNWEQSPDNPEMARYHFVIVDDRNRQTLMNKLIEWLSVTGACENIRSTEWKVRGDKCRYLFESYDSRSRPELIQWGNLPKIIIRDRNLKERKVGTIEDYVTNLYEMGS